MCVSPDEEMSRDAKDFEEKPNKAVFYNTKCYCKIINN
jgi:hypothetical protein